MADHDEASHSENLFVVIQDIRETPVHLVVFTGTGRIAAPAVALRRDLLTLGGDEMLVGGDVIPLRLLHRRQTRPDADDHV